MRLFAVLSSVRIRTRTPKPWQSSRTIHHLRELKYSIEDGLGDFLPPAALKTVALDYQQGLLDRLNDEVRGTEEENKSVVQTVINTAANRSKAMAFNYASLALNNSFFLDMLAPPLPPETSHEDSLSPYFSGTIRSEHGSLEQLKSNFSAAALGMASSGWVWFVTDRKGKTGVLPTFGAGTLLIRSRSNVSPILLEEPMKAHKNGGASKQPESSPSNGVRDSSSFSNPLTPPPLGLNRSPTSPNHISPRSIHSDSLDAQPASFFSAESYAHNLPPDILKVGEVICPLFCVSVHEHAWMSAGYGVWGKEEWLKKFWTVLDWGEVSRSFEKFVPDEQRF